MKTLVAVLCALLATAARAFAHGSEGGAPVMLPAGPPVMTPIQGGIPIFSRMDPVRETTPDRTQKRPLLYRDFNYTQICRPPVYLPTPFQVYGSKGGPPNCGDQFIEARNGLIPYWIPPGFTW